MDHGEDSAMRSLSARHRADQVAEQLRAQLPPEAAHLVQDLILAEEEAHDVAWNRTYDLIVEGFCQHLPGLAPALRLVAEHVLPADDEEDLADCCAEPRTVGLV